MPGLHIRTFTEYVTDENVAQVVKEKSLVLSAVDNHPARAVVARHAATLQNICVLSAGNEKWDGNVHVYLRRAGRDMSVPLIDRHPEIAKSKAGDRATLGCDELITLGQSQLLVTNFLAASALLVAFHVLWERDEIHKSRAYRQSHIPQEIFFDVRAQAMSAIPVAGAATLLNNPSPRLWRVKTSIPGARALKRRAPYGKHEGQPCLFACFVPPV